MADYHVYLVDPQGRVQLAEVYSCESDEEAVARLHPTRFAAAVVELWQGGRRLAAVPRAEG